MHPIRFAPEAAANGPVAGHSPLVATVPIIWQYAGTVNVPAATVTVDGSTRVAEVTVTFGTFNEDATHVGAVVVGAKPRFAAHWACKLPLTKLGPKLCVGGGTFLVHCRLPPTDTRLMSEEAR